MIVPQEEQYRECKQIISDSIIWEFKQVGISRDDYVDNITIEMQIYAKWYAEQVIKHCANETNHPDAFYESRMWWIPKDSILKIIKEL